MNPSNRTEHTLYQRFQASAERYPERPLLAVPARLVQAWDVPRETRFDDALARVEHLRAQYGAAGLEPGDRLALAFESRPEFVFHYLALNALGVAVVPLNTDLTATELAYQIAHSACRAAVCLPELAPLLDAAVAATGRPLPVSSAGPVGLALVRPSAAPAPAAPADDRERIAAILYTSGTTGQPKGCVLTNTYLLETADYNAQLPGDLAVAEGAERILNPLPLYHMNAMASTLGVAITKGACFVMPGRFSASNWWQDIADTKATRFNYLGIMVPALLAQPESPQDRTHGIRFAFGAGLDPALHARFEERFGIGLMEVWGMTETGRFLVVDREPRMIDTRACGRPLPGLQARIVNEAGEALPDGQTGELVVRHSEAAPRHGFFSGYLDDPAATEAAWTGGWFHSGDLCQRSADGMFFFVDRRKNIVRRSGENISAAEVEAALSASPLVAQVAVLAVPDALRDEEVLACIVPAEGHQADADLAASVYAFTATRLAYYKTPGWIRFVESLPITGTQKVQKHRLLAEGFSETLPGLHDLRNLKRWKK